MSQLQGKKKPTKKAAKKAPVKEEKSDDDPDELTGEEEEAEAPRAEKPQKGASKGSSAPQKLVGGVFFFFLCVSGDWRLTWETQGKLDAPPKKGKRVANSSKSGAIDENPFDVRMCCFFPRVCRACC